MWVAAAPALASPPDGGRRLVAHGGAGHTPLDPAATPPAPAGTDGARAEHVLAEVAAKSKDPALARVVASPVQSARRALERARGARAAGDAPHARMLDGLALEWAETARDLLRAASVEADATKTGRKAAEAATQVDRARALLAEAQARRGRAAGELERVEAEAKDAAKAAADAEDARLAKKKPPAPPAAPKPSPVSRPVASKPPSKPAPKKSPAKGAP